TTAKVKTINDEVRIQALIDEKRINIKESSICLTLKLDDAEGTSCLATTEIFNSLAKMGYEKLSEKLTFYKAFFLPQWKFLIHTILQCLSAKTTSWNEFSSTMASAIICLAIIKKFNFLRTSVSYALTASPTIRTSCIKQFWTTAKVKTINDEVWIQALIDEKMIQALVDKKKVIITEDNIRSDLHFDDAEGTMCLPSEEIFKGLARMGTMASAIICLADNQKFNFSKYILDHMVKSLEGGIKYYLFLRFLQTFLDNQVKGMRIGAGFSGIITPLFDTMMVQADADMRVTLVETHQPPIVDQSTSRPQKKQKPMRKHRKEAEVSHDESEDEDNVPTPSSDPLPGGKDSYTLYELMAFLYQFTRTGV
nr:ribonuclease H-like domain-containing protein [Tanacetum cinerariifolium]